MQFIPFEIIFLVLGAAAVRFSVKVTAAFLILATTFFVFGHAFPWVSDAMGFGPMTPAQALGFGPKPSTITPLPSYTPTLWPTRTPVETATLLPTWTPTITLRPTWTNEPTWTPVPTPRRQIELLDGLTPVAVEVAVNATVAATLEGGIVYARVIPVTYTPTATATSTPMPTPTPERLQRIWQAITGG